MRTVPRGGRVVRGALHDPWAENCAVLGGVETPDPKRTCRICDGTQEPYDFGEVPF